MSTELLNPDTDPDALFILDPGDRGQVGPMAILVTDASATVAGRSLLDYREGRCATCTREVPVGWVVSERFTRDSLCLGHGGTVPVSLLADLAFGGVGAMPAAVAFKVLWQLQPFSRHEGLMPLGVQLGALFSCGHRR